MSNCSREFRAAAILLLMGIGFVLPLSRAEATTQSLCVNPGGTGGCAPKISDAVALITASKVTITVAAGTYLDHVSINTGTPPKKLTLMITGTAGAGSTTIDGNSAGSVFTIGAKATVTIDGLTIENGLASGGSTTLGGGISASGATLTVMDGVVTNNRANFGAGIYTTNGNLTIADSTIANNGGLGMGSSGGGVYFAGKARKLTIADSTIDSNSAAFGGGVIITGGTGPSALNGIISDSTISNNRSFASSEGAGLFVQFAKLTMTNSTISGNMATGTTGQGGGICTFVGNVMLNNVTVANNSATDTGGGILANINDQKFVVSNTIIADNFAPAATDCLGTLMSHDYNFIGKTTSCTLTGKTAHNLTGDPKLGPLGNNGGTTETQALLSGSPALGAGNPATPDGIGNHCKPADQIGTPRPKGKCDIGAYQHP
jgi:Right handed beta helix region